MQYLSHFISHQTGEGGNFLLKPTPTPVPFYSPPDPNIINIIITLGVLICVIILIGIWINRDTWKK